MKKPMRIINATHKREKDKAQPNENYQDCPALLRLCIGAPVRLNVNLWVKAGLYNGASGTVVDIIDDPDCKDKNGLPACVLVQMDKKYKGINSCVEGMERVVPIFPKEICNRDSKKSFGRSRTQIPLSLDWGRTIHKAQGMTMENAIIDITHKGKNILNIFFFFLYSYLLYCSFFVLS